MTADPHTDDARNQAITLRYLAARTDRSMPGIAEHVREAAATIDALAGRLEAAEARATEAERIADGVSRWCEDGCFHEHMLRNFEAALADLAAEREAHKQTREALDKACDVATWLTGAADLSDVPGWAGGMRDKLKQALAALGEATDDR